MDCIELLITFVREYRFIYDKTDKEYKNSVKRKKVWLDISEKMKIHGVDMTAEEVEKKWASLRDMFARERRKQNMPSGSGNDGRKEWEYYKFLKFLSPFVAHRRTRTLPLSVVTEPTLQVQAETELQSSSQSQMEPPIQPHSYIETPLQLFAEPQTSEVRSETPIVVTVLEEDPCDSQNSLGLTVTPLSKRKVPALDNFAKRRKKVDEATSNKLEETQAAITKAITTMTDVLAQPNISPSVMVINEQMNLVPENQRMDCLIAVLQTIKSYQA